VGRVTVGEIVSKDPFNKHTRYYGGD